MQLGFFNIETKKSRGGTKAPLRLDCESCGLYKSPIRHPQMDPSGDGELDIMVMGEGPGEVEDMVNQQWRGPVGQLLQSASRRAGVDLFRDCITINAVNCRPTEPAKTKELKNRAPTSMEIACCRQVKVLPAIEKYHPKVIVVAGYPALQSIVGSRFGMENLDPISKWTGACIPDRLFKAWICPVFHPSFVARDKFEALRTIWERDLRRAYEMRERELPEYEDEEKFVKVLTSQDDIEDALRRILHDSNEVVIDIETTGLKPYNTTEHEIVSWGIAPVGQKNVISFLHPKSERCKILLGKILRHPQIGKVAWNMKFEHVWIATKMGIEVKPWVWDPMQVVHLRDNRTGICGLDIQAYMKFGRTPWDTELREYMRGKDQKNKNSPNRLLEFVASSNANRDKLLTYGGLDVQLTKMLLKDQRLTQKSPLHDLVHEGAIAFADAEMAGFRVDEVKGKQQYAIVSKKIEFHEKLAQQGEVFQALEKRYGSKANLNSGDQLAVVLFDDLKYKPLRVTGKKQRGAVDDDLFERLNLPDLNEWLEAKKLAKIRDTYLEGFLRERGHDGFVHPFISLHTTRSGRSSAENPNLQNVPIREERALRICRGVIFPRKGHAILEPDFAGIEVRVAACYCKDPTLIKYVTDSSTDMHRDMAVQIFIWKGAFEYQKHKQLKHLRYSAKNGFVFPEFYGSYYEQTAAGLAAHVQLPQGRWDRGMGIELPGGDTLGRHMIEQGVKSYADFVEHLKQVERDFWYKRFKVYTNWKDDWWEEYQRRGYCESFTGFPAIDVLSRNESLNRHIQGDAFRCLLKLYVKMWKRAKAEGWDSRLFGQVHDSLLWDALEDEIPTIIENTKECVEEVRKEWKWIIVPLEMEFERTAVDAPWSEKKAA